MRPLVFPSIIFIWLSAITNTTVHAEVINLEGTIKSVDAKRRTITLDTGSKTLTLDVSSKAKVSVGGKDSNLDLLKGGQKVSVSYHDKLEVVLKVEADSQSSAAEGGWQTLSSGNSLDGWMGNTRYWT